MIETTFVNTRPAPPRDPNSRIHYIVQLQFEEDAPDWSDYSHPLADLSDAQALAQNMAHRNVRVRIVERLTVDRVTDWQPVTATRKNRKAKT